MICNYIFRNPDSAFTHAIRSDHLTIDPRSDYFAARYMYMGTQDGVDLFKHKETRDYVRVRFEVQS